MKLTIISLLFFTFQVSAKSYAQKITIVKKNASLTEIFKAIERQTGFLFFYDKVIIQKSEPIDISIKDATLEEALSACLQGQKLTYSIVKNTVVIMPDKATVFFPAQATLAPMVAPEPPPIEIHGSVTDQQGNPLANVSVVVVGTSVGTTTTTDGRFSITAPDNRNVSLEFSSVGFVAKRVPIGTDTDIEVVLEATNLGLSEVVVVGYGTQKKENLTGAVSSVNSEVLDNRPLTDLGQGLQGTIANLNITTGSGAGGQGSNFNIRGATSINGGAPLILVDGVSMDINLINPQDVASVTVLKDAASAAIYGARAAFGVILITTKTGRREKPTISVNSSYSINKPTKTIDWFNSKDIVEWMDAAFMRTTGQPYYDPEQEAAILAHFNSPSTAPSAVFIPRINSSEWLDVGNTDWNSILMRSHYPMQQHGLSISGGTEKFRYYTSFGFLKQGGIINPDLFDEEYTRYNVLTNLSYKVNNWIEVTSRISGNLSNKRFAPNDPWFRNIFPEDALPFQTNNYATQALRYPDGNWTHEGSIQNPAQVLSEGGYQKRNINDFWLTGGLHLTPLTGLNIFFDYTYNPRSTEYMSYFRHIPFFDVNGNQSGFYGGSNPNRVIRENQSHQYQAYNLYGDYSRTFGGHNFKIMAGFNQEFNSDLTVNSERRNLIIDAIPYMSLASGDRFITDGQVENAIRGLFGRFNYDFNGKYLFEFDGRYDGSSRFPSNNRFAFFPSGSIGWRIDQEGFFKNLKESFFDLLKVRASYGSLGNQAVLSNYPYIAAYSTGDANYLIGGVKPVQVVAPPLISPTLTWETVNQTDIGLDFAILKSKLMGSFDVYRRSTKNMLTTGATLPSVLGTPEPTENAADLKTEGWDLTLDWNESKSEFRYGVSFTLSNYKAVITRFSNPAGLISDYYVGKDLGEIWGLVTGGIFQTDAEAADYKGNKIAGFTRKAGDLWQVDLDNNKEISYGSSTLNDPGDRKIIGNNTPKYSFGLRGFIAWKNFDATVFFQGVGKRDLWMNTKYYLTVYTGEWTPRPEIFMDYWRPDNPDAFYPAPRITNTGDITAVQTRFLQNAAYVRLKQATLGYTFPINNWGWRDIKTIRIFFTGSNLWTGTKMVKIADPELAGPSMYPLYKSYTFGLNLQF